MRVGGRVTELVVPWLWGAEEEEAGEEGVRSVVKDTIMCPLTFSRELLVCRGNLTVSKLIKMRQRNHHCKDSTGRDGMNVDEGTDQDVNDSKESLIDVLKVSLVKNLYNNDTILSHMPRERGRTALFV